MPLHEERSVRIDGCVVVWDGIKSPEQTDQGGFKYTLKVVVNPNSPDLAILDQLGRQCLQESPFKGNLPAGGHWIMKQAEAHEFNGMFPGWWVVNGITYQQPQVFDEQGNILQAMQYGPALFPGQVVNILVSAKDYNQKSKGIKAQLEGFQIVASANAQQIHVGGSSVNAAGAFGGGAQPAQNANAVGSGFQSPQQQPQPGYGAPAAQGANNNPPAQGYGAPQGGAPQHQPNPQGGAPGGYGQPTQNQPAQNAAPQGYGAPNGPAGGAPAQGYGAPSQAHNFLPGQGQ